MLQLNTEKPKRQSTGISKPVFFCERRFKFKATVIVESRKESPPKDIRLDN